MPRIFAFFTAILFAACAHRPTLSTPLAPHASVRSGEFRQAMGAMIPPGFVGGNRLETLNNGAEIFPAMLTAIRGAKKSINFETFIFYKGEVPREFADALVERARAGVTVNVILDALGAGKSRSYHREMRDAGIHLELFHRLFWINAHRYNYRTHRKLLIVDGRVGFIGGVGIGDEWNGRASTPEEWRDLHYRVEGPVVAQMQGAFNDDWLETHHEVLQGAAYYPPLPPAGAMAASVIQSSPLRGKSNAELLFHLAISGARQSIRIETPYFIPDRPFMDALTAAARRGVRVQILMPGDHIDQKSVRRASRKRWPELLQAGVELYEYDPTMIHSKLIIVDDYFVSVGSSNFDPRSLRINNEANLSVLDAGFAAGQIRVFQRDLRRSRRVTGKESAGVKKAHEAPIQAAQTPVESQL